MNSVAAWFRAAAGRQIVKRIEGAPCVEDWPVMLADYRSQLESQGAVEGRDFTIDNDGLHVGNRFIRKPKQERESRGVMVIRSADYGFPNSDGRLSWGDKKGAKVVDGRLVKDYGDWRVTFEIVEG